jgi:hypothetical protein
VGWVCERGGNWKRIGRELEENWKRGANAIRGGVEAAPDDDWVWFYRGAGAALETMLVLNQEF